MHPRPTKMATKRGNPDQYLQLVGKTYYARVRVPRTLEKLVGQTHIRRSLQTSSRAEANLRKHAAVQSIKVELAKLRTAPPSDGKPGMSFADARRFREELEQVRAAGDHEHASTLEDVAVSRAERLEEIYGYEHAKRWHRAATTTTKTLAELMDQWLAGRDFRESTKLGHRKALAEVLTFLRDEDAHPGDVTHEKALAYIDNDLMQRGLAANTIRDRLVSLGGFWSWLGSRNVVPRGFNPWKGHHISRKQHTGTRPPKRKGGYTDEELLKLLVGNERVRAWPTYSYLPDLAVLGMFSGARLESLAALMAERVAKVRGGYVLQIENDKTEAGTRPVGITHPAAVAVLARRMKGRKGSDQLFPELEPGGADDKLSASATKAYGRYRRACDVPDGTDFHSFRRNVITILEHAGLIQGDIARFVGHKLGTISADTYAGPPAAAWSLEVSRNIRYSKAVEAAALNLAGR